MPADHSAAVDAEASNRNNSTGNNTPRARRNVTFNVANSNNHNDSNLESAKDGPLSGSTSRRTSLAGPQHTSSNAGKRSPLSEELQQHPLQAHGPHGGNSSHGSRKSSATSRNSSVVSPPNYNESASGSAHHSHRTDGGGNSPFLPFTANAATAQPPFTLTKEDVLAAFNFFDVQGTGYLTMTSLKPRLSAFYPNLTTKEYRFLLEDPVSVGGGSSNGNGNHTDASPSSRGANNAATHSGFTAEHLWELIDTYQKLYTGRSAPSETSSASPLFASPHSHTSSRSTHRSSGANVTTQPFPSTAAAGATAATTQVFDPVYEAFRVYDPTGKNKCVDTQVLAHIMARIGYGELSEEEVALLVRTADFDGDGKISLEDFRHLVSAKGRSSGGGAKHKK